MSNKKIEFIQNIAQLLIFFFFRVLFYFGGFEIVNKFLIFICFCAAAAYHNEQVRAFPHFSHGFGSVFFALHLTLACRSSSTPKKDTLTLASSKYFFIASFAHLFIHCFLLLVVWFPFVKCFVMKIEILIKPPCQEMLCFL